MLYPDLNKLKQNTKPQDHANQESDSSDCESDDDFVLDLKLPADHVFTDGQLDMVQAFFMRQRGNPPRRWQYLNEEVAFSRSIKSSDVVFLLIAYLASLATKR